MKVTKYEHACLVVEEQGKRLVIDPGGFSISLPDNLDNVVAIVITHVHGDHLAAEAVTKLVAGNPGVVIYGTEEVAKELTGTDVKVVTGGNEAEVAPFKLQFFGGKHAHVHDTWPLAQNVGVLVNQSLYYPGDSYDQPNQPVKVLAVPTSGPWMKTGEAMDFLIAVKPKLAFPTHDAFLSEIGEGFVNDWLDKAAKEAGDEYRPIKPGESFEV